MKKSNMIALSAAALTALLALVSFRPSVAAEPSNFLLHWPTPTGADAKYGVIDGKHMWQNVVEQGKIATDYRDNGHPQFWGRITGTSADEASQKWLMDKFKQAGLKDVHAQPMLQFLPQWNAKSWAVSMTAGGTTTALTSATPPYGSPDTGNKEIDLEVVYVGSGTPADFKGRDVRGKAVLFVKENTGYNLSSGARGAQARPAAGAAPAPRPAAVLEAQGALKLAQDGGAAAILGYDQRGENLKIQAYRAYTTVPTFQLGTEDGNRLRDAAGGAAPPHIKIRLDADWNGGQKSALIWGMLPGATDETVYILAHRDGWYQAAGDNAVGVAGMIGLAEYYAKIPQAQRKRTMYFIGSDGHHAIRPGWYGQAWLVENRDKLFKKTALFINVEHPAETATRLTADGSNAVYPNGWIAGGPSRPKLEAIARASFHEFGVPIWENPTGSADLGYFSAFLPGVGVESDDFIYMHTEGDNPEVVAWAGMESIIRSYAKIIDEVNKLPLSDLQRPWGPNVNNGALDLSKCQAWIQGLLSKPCSP